MEKQHFPVIGVQVVAMQHNVQLHTTVRLASWSLNSLGPFLIVDGLRYSSGCSSNKRSQDLNHHMSTVQCCEPFYHFLIIQSTLTNYAINVLN